MTPESPPQIAGQFQVLTAPGPGAVAVVEVRCEAVEAAAVFLRRVRASRQHSPGLEINRISYGRWDGEDLVVVRIAETIWEIQCHGGLIAVQRICRDLMADGFVETSVASVVSDAVACDSTAHKVRRLIEVAIQTQLPKATTRKTAGLILAQGTNSLADDLTFLLSADAELQAQADDVRRRLNSWRNVAMHLTEPWRVVLLGPPNVGKSSLMNSIAGMERSIVCDQPGTTRDSVEVETILGGWSFRFTDTAGLRESTLDEIEQHGMRQSLLAASDCEVLCLVVDHTTESRAWMESLNFGVVSAKCVVLRNKADLIPADSQSPWQPLSSQAGSLPVLNVSAVTQQGLPELLTWIYRAVVPCEPGSETALPLPGLPIAQETA